MANSHRPHRLERLFSIRRPASSRRSAESREPSQPIFPQPSFISPKSSRMMAREEVWAKSSSPRTQSLPHSRSSFPISFSQANLLGDAHFERASVRAGSPLERSEVTMSGPQVSRHSSHISQPNEEFSASTSHPISASEHPMTPGRGSGSKATMPQLQRLDTPPASDTGDSSSLESKSTSPQSNSLPHTGLPTPGPSPDMNPVSDSSLAGHPGAIGDLNTGSAIENTREGPTDETSPANENFEPQVPAENDDSDSSQTAVLKEPTLDDFLHLSDDDIAEEQSENTEELEDGSQPFPPIPPSWEPHSRVASSFTLPSPSYSRPATAAAFEAARIAARHNFDLLYVVNLWPGGGNGRDPRSTPTKLSSYQAPKIKGRMKGRFLAAYGLSTVKYPFQISTMVHKRILQSEGWIEYRNDEAKSADFARGYACAFHRGQYGGPHTTASKSGGENVNRGIVFAAYRKPGSDGNNPEVDCNQTQLSTIYRDAEALVEMLIDLHKADRTKNPASKSPYSDETGPMPMPNSVGESW